jgi:RNA polymerase sigma-70 factor (ECF subfamily)
MFAQAPHPKAAPADECVKREWAKERVSGLFAEWYGPLVRFAFRSTGSLDAAEDVVQASFTELYRALLQGRSIENPKGWTLCVVRREIVDRAREQKRHGGPFLALSDVEGLASPHVRPDFSWSAEADITRLLAGLSQREEQVLLLRAQAMKYRQIADELKIGINSVKTLLARAIRKMQQTSAAGRGQNGSKRDDDTIPTALQ